MLFIFSCKSSVHSIHSIHVIRGIWGNNIYCNDLNIAQMLSMDYEHYINLLIKYGATKNEKTDVQYWFDKISGAELALEELEPYLIMAKLTM